MPYNSIPKDWDGRPEWWVNQGAEVAPITQGKVSWYGSMIPWHAIMPMEDSPWATYTPPKSPAWGPSTGEKETEEEPGEPSLPPITWSEKYQASGAPDWWRGLVPSRYDPQTEYATMLNAMMPYMSPEDQRYTASVLYRMYPEQFAGYNPETTKMPPIPGEMTTDERREMTSRRRAKDMLGILETVKRVSGEDAAFGPGYNYLRQLASTMRDFGGKKTAGQTRQQFAQMMAALDPLTAETQGSQLSAYSSLTRMLSQPYYTAGAVTPTSQLENGQTIFGGSIPGYF